MPYKESINNASTAHVRIVTSTVSVFYVGLNIFLYIKTVSYGQYTSNFMRKQQISLLGITGTRYALYYEIILNF